MTVQAPRGGLDQGVEMAELGVAVWNAGHPRFPCGRSQAIAHLCILFKAIIAMIVVSTPVQWLGHNSIVTAIVAWVVLLGAVAFQGG
jgi:hypothetical protein